MAMAAAIRARLTPHDRGKHSSRSASNSRNVEVAGAGSAGSIFFQLSHVCPHKIPSLLVLALLGIPLPFRPPNLFFFWTFFPLTFPLTRAWPLVRLSRVSSESK